MKKLTNVVVLGLLVALLFSIGTAFAAQDELECVLPNGDKFILINKYNYSPLAKFFPHAAERTNEKGWEVYFDLGRPLTAARSLGGLKRYGPHFLSDEAGRKKLCSSFFFFNEYVYFAWYQMVRKETLIVKEPINAPSKKVLKSVGKIFNGETLYTPRNTVPLYIKDSLKVRIEFPLTKQNLLSGPNVVDAIMVFESGDNGQTWSEAIVTTDANLFVIGKAMLDQPAIAKPGKWKKGPGRF